MLMDFQIEGGQAVAAEIAAEMQDLPRYRGPSHEVRTFELPASVWIVMFACYAVFFAALFVATGRGIAAIFALLVSIASTVSVPPNEKPCRLPCSSTVSQRRPAGWTTAPPLPRF